MKKISLSLVIVAASAASAFAADLPVKAYKAPPAPIVAAYDWSGFYIGGNAGYASSHLCFDNVGFVGAPAAPVHDNCGDATGGFVGGQLGYRWQMTSWVFGLEAQGNWASMKGTATSTLFPGITGQAKIDGFGLFTGQIGYAWNNILLYVKGGAAVVDDNYAGLTTATGTVVATNSEDRWGGAVGVGLNFGFAPNWTVGVEYNHLFLGSRDIPFSNTVIVAVPVERIHQDMDIGLVRVDYHFGGPVVAKY